jgi:hypothetical protein
MSVIEGPELVTHLLRQSGKISVLDHRGSFIDKLNPSLAADLADTGGYSGMLAGRRIRYIMATHPGAPPPRVTSRDVEGIRRERLACGAKRGGSLIIRPRASRTPHKGLGWAQQPRESGSGAHSRTTALDFRGRTGKVR